MVTLSPARTRMRLRRSLPARWARTIRSCSSCTLNSPLGNFSNTVPVTSMLSSLLINLHNLRVERPTPEAPAVPSLHQPTVTLVACNPLGPFVTSNSTRSEEHTSELQSLRHLVCRLLLEKNKFS